MRVCGLLGRALVDASVARARANKQTTLMMCFNMTHKIAGLIAGLTPIPPPSCLRDFEALQAGH